MALLVVVVALVELVMAGAGLVAVVVVVFAELEVVGAFGAMDGD
jgi:hypothetical protein